MQTGDIGAGLDGWQHPGGHAGVVSLDERGTEETSVIQPPLLVRHVAHPVVETRIHDDLFRDHPRQLSGSVAPLGKTLQDRQQVRLLRLGRLPPDLTARPPDRLKIRPAQEADERRPSGTECERLASIEIPETHNIEPPLVHHRVTERLAKGQLPRRRRLQVDHRRQDRQPQLSDEPGGVLEAAEGQVRPVPSLELHVSDVAFPTPPQEEHQIHRAFGRAQLEDPRRQDPRARIPGEREEVSGPGPEEHLQGLISVHGPKGSADRGHARSGGSRETQPVFSPRVAELHWYGAHGIGREDMEVKRLLE